MKVDLTIEERLALLRLIKAALDSPRHPLSPQDEVLRRIAEKLGGEERTKGKG